MEYVVEVHLFLQNNELFLNLYNLYEFEKLIKLEVEGNLKVILEPFLEKLCTEKSNLIELQLICQSQHDCSLTEISKYSFKYLQKLKKL